MPSEEIPKTEWGDGPWQGEPDDLYWTDQTTGLPCAIHRGPVTGALCGYVGVPSSHIAHGLHYDGSGQGEMDAYMEFVHQKWRERGALAASEPGDPERPEPYAGFGQDICQIDVHGGLTYSGKFHKQQGEHWFFGFDCAHAGDKSPAMDALLKQIGFRSRFPPLPAAYRLHDVYRDIAYVTGEVLSLAQQLKALGDKYRIPEFTAATKKEPPSPK